MSHELISNSAMRMGFFAESLTHFSLRDVAHAEFVSVLICSLSDAEFRICVADYARRKRV